MHIDYLSSAAIDLVWVDVAAFHVPLRHILKSEPRSADVPFSLTELKIQLLSRKFLVVKTRSNKRMGGEKVQL